MTELVVVNAAASERLEGKLSVYRDDLDGVNCIVIRWDRYRGRVAWSEDEREFKSPHWFEIIRLRAWAVIDDMLRLKRRDERAAEAVK